MPVPAAFAALADEKYVSLTTFRRSGLGVPTAVWVAADGDDLVVTTMSTSGKVKRLRHDPRVWLVPCSMRGRVDADAVPVEAVAVVVDDPAGIARGNAALEAKYGWQFRMALRMERRGAGDAHRVILRITAAG